MRHSGGRSLPRLTKPKYERGGYIVPFGYVHRPWFRRPELPLGEPARSDHRLFMSENARGQEIILLARRSSGCQCQPGQETPGNPP